MEYECHSIHIGEIVALKKAELGENERGEIEKLDVALQSIQKRLNYCEYHYSEFIQFSDETSLKQDRYLQMRIGGISVRTRYEANAYGFLQNLHALLDSLPYALNIFECVCADTEARSIGWEEKFIKKYALYSFASSLSALCTNKNFSKLKGLVNRYKHRHVIRIKNDGGSLKFEDFTYWHNGTSEKVTDQDVKLMLSECELTQDKSYPR